MKTNLMICMAAFTFLFTQQLAAQEVSSVLRSKEKRQVLYSSIMNNDQMFYEFFECMEAAGRTNDGMNALNNKMSKASQAVADLEFKAYENKLVMEQMVSLIMEYANKNPEFQKIINEKYPAVGEIMKKDQMKL